MELRFFKRSSTNSINNKKKKGKKNPSSKHKYTRTPDRLPPITDRTKSHRSHTLPSPIANNSHKWSKPIVDPFHLFTDHKNPFTDHKNLLTDRRSLTTLTDILTDRTHSSPLLRFLSLHARSLPPPLSLPLPPPSQPPLGGAGDKCRQFDVGWQWEDTNGRVRCSLLS